MLLAVLALATATTDCHPHARYYEKLAHTYFNTWNNHDVEGLRALFAEDVTLRDWNVEASGASKVAAANGDIFKSVPKISIDVLTIHVSEHTKTALCEILVKLHNAKDEVLKVADVITFNSEGKITAVRAYKG